MSDSKLAPRETLELLHAEIAKQLMEKIKNGEATAADFAVARQFLKDNGVDNISRTPGSPLDGLVNSLPFPNAESVEAEEHNSYAH